MDSILGNATERHIAEQLHHVEHHGGIEYLTLPQDDTQRHRLRALTDRGTECAIALPRAQRLMNGSVLLLEHGRAIVVRMRDAEWLELEPCDTAAALELGYFAGNMHWKVEFHGSRLRIAMQGPIDFYLERLAHLTRDGRVRRTLAA